MVNSFRINVLEVPLKKKKEKKINTAIDLSSRPVSM